MKDVSATEANVAKPDRQRSETPFPAYSLGESISVAESIHKQGGGVATPEHLAAFLEYKSTNNGAFINRVAAARHFKLIAGGGRGGQYTITPLAERILMPVYPESAREALLEAFLIVPLFQAVYDEYKGKELPTDFGFKNMLRTRFGIAPARVGLAYRVLMESAETAGFFATRGARTHLIIPSIGRTPTPPAKDEKNRSGGDNGTGAGGVTPPTPPKTKEDLQSAYIATLIDLLGEKGRKGEGDPELMERIEKLLALK